MCPDYKSSVVLKNRINENINNLKLLIEEFENLQHLKNNEQEEIQNVKDNIIGKLPRRLLSEKIFPKNTDIADFAKKYLEITIRNAEKKSRADLIGNIVVEVERLDTNKLIKFNNALNIVTEKTEKKSKESFFSQWEQAIKQMDLRE